MRWCSASGSWRDCACISKGVHVPARDKEQRNRGTETETEGQRQRGIHPVSERGERQRETEGKGETEIGR